MAKHRKKSQLKAKKAPTRRRPATRITPAGFVDGMPGPAGSELRLARPGESTDVVRFMAMAGVTPEPELVAAIEHGGIGSAVVEALSEGQRSILVQLARTATSPRPISELAGLAVVLVAHREGQLLGALLAYPPFSVMAQGVAGGVPAQQMLATGAVMARFKGLGVDEDARGLGVGSALIRAGMRLYRQLGYTLIYGQIRVGDGLERYYPRFGFEVLDVGQGLPLDPLGIPMGIAPEPGEQLIVQWR